MAALPVVLRVGWFRRGCGVGGDAGVAGHHGCVQKITEDAMRPLAEFTPFAVPRTFRSSSDTRPR